MDGLDMPKLVAIHSMRSFSALKTLSLVCVPTLHDGGLIVKETEMAQLIGMLSNLTELTFNCCPIANDQFLTLLADKAQQLTLESLSFIFCDNLTGGSTGLAKFLGRPLCRRLKTLQIRTCTKFSLSFLTTLAHSTPYLQTLAYEDQLFLPLIDVYQPPPQQPSFPTWPQTLTSLTLWCLKRISSESCSAFLESLLMAAPTLTNLRHVSIWCILALSHHAQAEFRKEWAPRLQQGFARRCNSGGAKIMFVF
jgi:hypothetical protein